MVAKKSLKGCSEPHSASFFGKKELKGRQPHSGPTCTGKDAAVGGPFSSL